MQGEGENYNRIHPHPFPLPPAGEGEKESALSFSDDDSGKGNPKKIFKPAPEGGLFCFYLVVKWIRGIYTRGDQQDTSKEYPAKDRHIRFWVCHQPL
jgi:hypothetical protein